MYLLVSNLFGGCEWRNDRVVVADTYLHCDGMGPAEKSGGACQRATELDRGMQRRFIVKLQRDMKLFFLHRVHVGGSRFCCRLDS